MNIRDVILQDVRNNQPSLREVPAIPKFHVSQSVDLKKQFTESLKEDPARSCRNCREHTRRIRSSPFPRQSVQLANVRAIRLGRHWGNHCASGPGSDDSYRYILAARKEREFANRLNLIRWMQTRGRSSNRNAERQERNACMKL